MKRIAVVEDNPDNRLLVKVILEPGYKVSEYETGAAALEGFARERPDVLLLDISLPEMDGVDVLRRIRATSELVDLPVIALTAHAMAGDREKYLGLGFDDYVSKPIVDEALLLDAIQRRLTGRAAAVPSSASTGAITEQALERLRKLGGDSFAAEMIGVFLEYTAQKIDQGLKASAAGDLGGVEKAMHPIKSSAGNVGAQLIQELAAQTEGLAKKREARAMVESLAELDNAFKSAKSQFEQTRQTLLTK